MEEKCQNHPSEMRDMQTDKLQLTWMATNLMQPGKPKSVYSHYKRIIIGGVMDATEPNPLGNHDQLESHIFLRSRGMGINSIAFRFYRKKTQK